MHLMHHIHLHMSVDTYNQLPGKTGLRSCHVG